MRLKFSLAAKIVAGVAVAVASAAVVFLAVATFLDFRPADVEPVDEYGCAGGVWGDGGVAAADVLPDTLRVLTWNVGYCGLGSGMDFFYDGGTRMRDSQDNTMENLRSVIGVIRDVDADVVLLQEVDRRSYRSYNVDQVSALCDSFPEYHVYYAPNYRSFFVPIPLSEPMRHVDGGLVVMSRFRPDSVVRFQYPSSFPYPVSLFNLKRCFLSAFFSFSDGGKFAVSNTHNTAYDTGGMRALETAFLASFLDSLAVSGVGSLTGGDWNQYPAAYVPSGDELTNAFFVPEVLDEEVLCRGRRVYFDGDSKTLRYLDHPLDSMSVRTVTDFFLVSDSLRVLDVSALELGFRNSDHEPVLVVVAR